MTSPNISEADIPNSIRSRFFMRNDNGYEQARLNRLFNMRHPTRYPAAILAAETEQDVVDGVLLAKRLGLRISVRSGGHSFPAWSVRDDALLIDTGNFKEMAYDAATGIVQATPAIQGGSELSPYLGKFDRFFPGGHCTDVGLGGYMLQGGMGWNARGWGWAAEKLVAIDVVTADGELVRADAEQNTDLFWAARGAGPGFMGIVTRFHLQTLPAPKALCQTTHRYPIALFDDVMTWLLSIHGDISPDVEVKAYTLCPPHAASPSEREIVVVGLTLSDTMKDAAAALEPFSTCPVLDQAIGRLDCVPTDFAKRYEFADLANPQGHRWAVDCAWLDGSPKEIVPAMRSAFAAPPNRKSFSMFFSMAPLRTLPDMALSLQTEVYVATFVVYEDASDDAKMADWLQGRMQEMQPYTAGQFLGDADMGARQVKFLGDAQWERLGKIRAARDPDGLFLDYLAKTSAPMNTNEWQQPS